MFESMALSCLIFLPAFFALLILSNKALTHHGFVIGLLSSAISLLLSLYIASHVPFSGEYVFQESGSWWLEGIDYRLAVDGLAASLIVLTAVIFPLCILSVQKIKKMPHMIALLLLLQTTIFGVFSAQDLVLFYLFFEASLIPMYLIIGIWGGAGRIAAGFKFFLYTLAGSLLMLVAIIYIYRQVGSTAFYDIMAYNFSFEQQKWLWLAFFSAL
ncbi:MAG: proton-conducting transporter membrane subunit, partial [Pseudomonadota bacterium]